MENGPDECLEAAVVDAGDGVAEDNLPVAGQAGRQFQHPPLPARAGPGSPPSSSAVIAAAQSMAAVPDPWWMKRAKSSRMSHDSWAMTRPVAASRA
jgi:hypothetical protein